MRKKVSVIGAGNVGAAVAQYLAEDNVCDITIFDVVEGLPQGKALDLLQAGPVRGYDISIRGTGSSSVLCGGGRVHLVLSRSEVCEPVTHETVAQWGVSSAYLDQYIEPQIKGYRELRSKETK